MDLFKMHAAFRGSIEKASRGDEAMWWPLFDSRDDWDQIPSGPIEWQSAALLHAAIDCAFWILDAANGLEARQNAHVRILCESPYLAITGYIMPRILFVPEAAPRRRWQRSTDDNIYLARFVARQIEGVKLYSPLSCYEYDEGFTATFAV